MKKISILIIVMFLTVLVGQTKAQAPKFNINETTKLITYSEVVQTTGVPVELFNRCIENFINKFYANPTGATSVRDKETGLIECKHQFKIYNVDKEGKLDMNKSAYVVAYVLTINFKDGRYKYTIDKFILYDIILNRCACERISIIHPEAHSFGRW